MKNRLTKFVSVLITLFFALSSVCFADMSVIVNDSKEITVSGLCDESRIIVTDFDINDKLVENKTYSQLTDSQKEYVIAEKMIYLREFDSASHTFSVDDYGVYTLFVNNNGTEEDSVGISIIDPEFAGKFRLVSTVEELNNLMNDSKSFLRLDFKNFYELSPDSRLNVVTRVFPKRENQDNYENIKAIMNLYTVLQEMIDNDDAVKIYNANSAVLNTNSFDEVYTYKYNNGDSSYKSQVLKKFATVDVAGTDDMADAFATGVILTDIKNCGNWQLIKSCVSAASEISGISTSAYNKLKSTKNVDLIVMNGNYNTLEEFLADVERKAADTDDGGGGSYGGSTGGGVVSYAPSVNYTVSDNNDSEKIIGKKMEFSDLTEDRWSYDAIRILYLSDVINGYEDGSFRPTNPVTRQEFVKMLVSAFDLVDKSATCEFEDVLDSGWAYQYIASAKKFGLVNGKTKNTFDPDDYMTREEAAVIAYNLVRVKNLPISLSRVAVEFSDSAEISDWSSDAIEYLYRCKILNGQTENTFAPKKQISREESAQVIQTLLTQGM